MGSLRRIGILVPDCTVEERHKDELEITRSPVEQGSPMTFHAYLKPCQLVMRVAWSNSTPLLGAAIPTVAITLTPAAPVRDIYAQLLALQASCVPFNVTTGKRTYTNMLMASLALVTNRESENVLMIEALLEGVIFASTQVQTASSLGIAANQASPQNTAAPAGSGTQQLGAANPAATATIGLNQ
jgi:hypothetical protein